jgi:signal transduction histidine kinase
MSDADKRQPIPGASLMLGMMLVLAFCIAVGGISVARRETETRRERDRQAQHALDSAMQAEARKLEALYDAHLRNTGSLLAQSMRDSEGARKAAQNVEGIQRVSWLFWKSASPETHLSIGFPADPPLPEPTIEKEHSGLPRLRVMLDAKRIFADAGGQSSGWIDEPGKPLMFYVQVLATAVVLTIDRAAVETAMNSHFRTWLEQEFSPVAQLGGADAVQDAHGQTLCSVGKLPAMRPDMLGPVISRFGVWQIVSWDERETAVSYHVPTVAGALALALLVAGCGIGMSVQHRRASLAAQQRVSFVNRVSHELRTPMTNILLNLDVIEESVSVSARSRVGLVREEAGRLSRLIENVLTFSRQEEGCLKLNPGPCLPAEIVSGIVRQFEPALLRRGIRLARTHEGPETESVLDADALAQITANLLSNVEKYAPGAAAAVHTRRTENEFTLTVRDEGPGIAESVAGRIFEPFYRVDDRVQAGVSGTGLGLSIAHDLAQRMGGALQLISSERGASFEFRLPFDKHD